MAAIENRKTFQPEEYTVIELSESSDEETCERLRNTESVITTSSGDHENIDIASSSVKIENEVPSQSAFNKFLSECINYLTLPDDQPIINKLTKYFELMDEDFRNSNECKVLVDSYTESIAANESQIYIFIRKVLNEFSSHRRKEVDSESEIPNKRYVKKLEKLLQKLDKKIKKIQEKEVDWDDNSDSVYLLESRLKARFVKVYKILCKVTGSQPCDGHSLTPKLRYEGTRYPEINRNISKYVNRTGVFPDYNTILTIVRNTSKEGGIYLNDEEMRDLAKTAFLEVGEELKQRRQWDFNFTFGCHLTDDVDLSSNDPAATDKGLKQKLDHNRIIAKNRLDEVIEKYAKEQEDSKAVPVEVGDGLDVFGSESEDEEVQEEEEGEEVDGNEEEIENQENEETDDEEEEEDDDDDDDDDDEEDEDEDEDSRSSDTVIAEHQQNSRPISDKPNGQSSKIANGKEFSGIQIKTEVHNTKRKHGDDDSKFNNKRFISSIEDHEVIVLD